MSQRLGKGPVGAFALAGAALVAGCARGGATASGDAPPKAPVREVVDDYFGQRITDPYRWMEAPGSPELRAWLEAQNRHTRAVLDRLPVRADLARRLGELAAEARSVDEARPAGGAFFFVERAGDATPVLRVRPKAGGAARTLVSLEGSGYSTIDYFFPSPSGRYLAYGVSRAGDEDSELHVIETATSRPIDRPVEHCRMAEVAWDADESGFFYTREPPREPGAAPRDAYTGMRVHHHALGTDPDGDRPLVGYGVAGSPFLEKDHVPRLLVDEGSPYAVVLLDHAVDDPIEIAIKRRDDLLDPEKPWRRVATPADGVLSVVLRGASLYVLTFKGAPFHRLERWDLDGDRIASRAVLLEKPGLTLQQMARTRAGVYVSGLTVGVSELDFVPFAGGPPRAVPLPSASFVSALTGDATGDTAAFRVETWTEPARWLTHVAADAAPGDAKLIPPPPTRLDGIVVEQLTARSADGTAIPITVLHRPGIALDGRNPTWLGAYGSYGIPIAPSYRPLRAAWLERGGVFAFAHVRGGGELGKPWHEAGQKLHKINSILDFVASAEELVRAGYTSPAHIAAFGQSAGGIVAHGAVVRRPELFAAAVVDVGDANMLRLEETPGGTMNAQEFGSVKTPDGFRALLEMDSYHRVRPGVRYPAMLLSTGANDPRVPPWQSAKMAARLQASTASDRPVLLRVSFDEGHGVGSTRKQEAERYADFFAFLFWQLGSAPSR